MLPGVEKSGLSFINPHGAHHLKNVWFVSAMPVRIRPTALPFKAVASLFASGYRMPILEGRSVRVRPRPLRLEGDRLMTMPPTIEGSGPGTRSKMKNKKAAKKVAEGLTHGKPDGDPFPERAQLNRNPVTDVKVGDTIFCRYCVDRVVVTRMEEDRIYHWDPSSKHEYPCSMGRHEFLIAADFPSHLAWQLFHTAMDSIAEAGRRLDKLEYSSHKHAGSDRVVLID